MQETVYQVGLKERGYSLTIALLADLHDTPCGDIVRSMKASKPDLITIVGDFVWGRIKQSNTWDQCIPIVQQSLDTLPFLSVCASIAPTFISLGNHERFVWEDDIELIQSTGCSLLDNSWAETPFHSNIAPNLPLLIGGLTSDRCTEFQLYRETNHITDRYFSHQNDFIGGGKPAVTWLDDFEIQEGYKLVLCHHPEYWEPYLRERHIDLVFSGHAHGGQVRIFGHGLYAPGQGLFPKYTSGIHAGPYGKLIVSRGLANTSRFIPRVFNPTELVYIK